jgi:hypothetical protein
MARDYGLGMRAAACRAAGAQAYTRDSREGKVMNGSTPSPVIDLFAGPGGLGEGFSSLTNHGKSAFRVALSIEMDTFAHQTLELRSFFRQFGTGKVPSEYYSFLRGEISRDD